MMGLTGRQGWQRYSIRTLVDDYGESAPIGNIARTEDDDDDDDATSHDSFLLIGRGD